MDDTSFLRGPRARAEAGRSSRARARTDPARQPPGARGRFRHVYAAIDLGTNNCRLLIARAEGEGFAVVSSFSRSVRLGEGLHRHGALSEAAMVRAIEAVKICAGKMRAARVTRTRAIATAACRHAANGREFVARLTAETGIPFDVITPAEEARLAVSGCAPLIDRTHECALVFDIGGGSTELIWLAMDAAHPDRVPQIVSLASIPVGVVTLAERFGSHRLPPEAFPQMAAIAREAFAAAGVPDAAAVALDHGRGHLLGTSGTVTTIAGLCLGLPRYDRTKVDGVWLDRTHALDMAASLVAKPYDARVGEPCIGHSRADLVLPGCAIFAAIAALWPAERLRIADRGLREGLLLGLMKRADREGRRRGRRRQGRR